MTAEVPIALARANARRHQSALSAAQGTINGFVVKVDQGQANFGAVARASASPEPGSIRQAELRDSIGRLRSTTAPAPVPSAQRASISSLRQRLETARAEVARLKAENAGLRDQLARQSGAKRALGAIAMSLGQAQQRLCPPHTTTARTCTRRRKHPFTRVSSSGA